MKNVNTLQYVVTFKVLIINTRQRANKKGKKRKVVSIKKKITDRCTINPKRRALMLF